MSSRSFFFFEKRFLVFKSSSRALPTHFSLSLLPIAPSIPSSRNPLAAALCPLPPPQRVPAKAAHHPRPATHGFHALKSQPTAKTQRAPVAPIFPYGPSCLACLRYGRLFSTPPPLKPYGPPSRVGSGCWPAAKRPSHDPRASASSYKLSHEPSLRSILP